MYNPLDLTNKIIIITGASSGIGRATSIYLSRLGAKVALIARGEEKLKETLTLLDGEGHRYYCYDLYDTSGIQALVSTIVSDMGAISGMTYCAGVGGRRPLAMIKSQHFTPVLTLNTYSYVEMIRCLMRKGNMEDGGSIVGISSIVSVEGTKMRSIYAAGKAAMDASTRCMAKELADRKIRLNTVRPAWVNTDRFKTYLSEVGEDGLQNDETYRSMLLGITQPEEVAALIAFLLSDAAKTITGASIHIDSGSTI